MLKSILATKLYIPPPRPDIVQRPRLIAQLNEGLHRKLTLISASAGSGKTTLIYEWVTNSERSVAWLSLDEDDNNPIRFLIYLVAALQTIMPNAGDDILHTLQSPQPPSIDSILTTLLNEITTIPEKFILVLDDYHVIDSSEIDTILSFIIQYLPARMHLVIATRQDPALPLARLRARNQLTELRVADLRFTHPETTTFLNQVMALNLSMENIAALETRTEGWIAGLQLAALSLRDHQNVSDFIESFTGSHNFVLDYLLEEVLHQQPENVQEFLLYTSISNRLSGPLCDALLPHHAVPGQETLKYLEQANLFLIPLDNERHWYRYHHLFRDLLRQRLHHAFTLNSGDDMLTKSELHRRASIWYENNHLELEAFHHATAAGDIDRATRLAEGGGMPLHFRGAVIPVLNWLQSLPDDMLNARPSLWVMYASTLSIAGQNTHVEEKLQAAEAAIADMEPDEDIRNLIGHIAAIRALLAAARYQIDDIITLSNRALEYLHSDNLPVRTATIWKLGLAYQLRGRRDAARKAYAEAVAISETTGNHFIYMVAATGLGNIQESDNQLHLAAETYQQVIKLAGDPPGPAASEASLGLARIYYQWNDLESALRYSEQSVRLARQVEIMDNFIGSEIFLAQIKLSLGDIDGASAHLTRIDQSARQHKFTRQLPEIAATQILILLRQGRLAAAAQLAQQYDLPVNQARVHLASGDTLSALDILDSFSQRMVEQKWADKYLQTIILQAVAYSIHGNTDRAIQLLTEALNQTAPEGFIRIFIDEGPIMAALVSEIANRGILPDYTARLLRAFKAEFARITDTVSVATVQPLIEPLSERELEVLRLVAQGLSNREISQKLYLALSTVKGHNQRIYGKLQVQRRTEAVARARELGLL